MKHENLAKQLKVIILGMGLCGILIYLWIIPMLGKEVVSYAPDFAGAYMPWLVFIWATAIPCYAALWFAWKIASNIGRDNSFCVENGIYMNRIAKLAAGDGIFFFLGNILLLLMNYNHPGIIIVSLFIVFIGLGIAVAASALSHLIMDAADLQEQSDFTI